MSTNSPSELLREVDQGKSETTPFIAIGATAIVVATAVIAVCLAVFAVYYLA